MRILVRSTQSLTELFLAFPFFVRLRDLFPGAKIDVAAPVHLQAAQFSGLVDEVFTFSQMSLDGVSWWQKIRALHESAAQLSTSTYDLGFALPSTLSSAYWLWRVGAKRRVGWAGDGRAAFLTDSLRDEAKESRHRSAHYLRLLAPFEKKDGAISSESFWPSLAENPLDRSASGYRTSFDPNKVWRENQGGAQPWSLGLPLKPGGYVVVAPWAEYETQCWPALQVRELMRRVLDETSLDVVIVGEPRDISRSRDVLSGWSDRVYDAVSKGNLSSYAPLFGSAAWVLSMDSAWAHLAAGVSGFVQVIWGGADPARMRPIGPAKIQLAVQPTECWPCERTICIRQSGEQLACLRETSVDVVWGEIQRGVEYSRARASALL